MRLVPQILVVICNLLLCYQTMFANTGFDKSPDASYIRWRDRAF